MATNTRSSITPHGVLPDEVIADPNSQGLIAFIAADPNTAPASIQAFLKELTAVLRSLEQPDDGVASIFPHAWGLVPASSSPHPAPRVLVLARTAPRLVSGSCQR